MSTIILVTDASQRSALAITRSLGRKGIKVITCDSSTEALAGTSKFSGAYFQFTGDNMLNPDDYIRFLRDIISRNNITAIFPATDLSIDIILSHWDQLNTDSDLICISPSRISYDTVSNKNKLFQIAEKIGVKSPKCDYYASLKEFSLENTTIQYPTVLKPYKSVIAVDNTYIQSTVHIVHNKQELLSTLNDNVYFLDHPFTVQEFIEGKGAGIFSIYQNGENRGFFAHNRLKEKPPGGGVSVLSESIKPPEKLRDAAKALLDHVKWESLAMVEFRVAEDGTPYLMEINGRPWGSIQLAIDSGFDFPYLAYLAAHGEEIEPVTEYRTGVKLRWLLGDLDRLYLIWKGSFGLNEKLKATVSFLNFFSRGVKFEVNRLIDMRPFFYEIRRYIKDIVG